jgi:CsoR family transcriptional regulator, copper-sensing transcriptional repressor
VKGLTAMSDTQRRVARLKTIAGHVRGVQRMEQAGTYCIDIIKQTQAIQAALDKFAALVMEHHLETCVTETIRTENKAERERVVTELLHVFAPLTQGEERSDDHFVIPRLEYLQKVESDVQQIEQLVGNNAYCIDIIRQAQQVKAALEQFNVRILSDHLKGCVTDAIRGDNAGERERKLSELLQIFTTANTLQTT